MYQVRVIPCVVGLYDKNPFVGVVWLAYTMATYLYHCHCQGFVVMNEEQDRRNVRDSFILVICVIFALLYIKQECVTILDDKLDRVFCESTWSSHSQLGNTIHNRACSWDHWSHPSLLYGAQYQNVPRQTKLSPYGRRRRGSALWGMRSEGGSSQGFALCSSPDLL